MTIIVSNGETEIVSSGQTVDGAIVLNGGILQLGQSSDIVTGDSVASATIVSSGGEIEILFQNASTTQLFEEQISGTSVTGGGFVSTIPGAGWGVHA